MSTTLAFLVGVALSCDSTVAADKTKVDRGTNQVEQGAKQSGQDNVGQGVKETAKGIGHTVVDGAKFSGENVKELPEDLWELTSLALKRPGGAGFFVPWPGLQVGTGPVSRPVRKTEQAEASTR